MFETSQPNSEFNSDELNTDKFKSQSADSKPNQHGKNAIKSLEALSKWIDVQLEKLEERFKAFETKESNRSYFQRKS